MTPLVRSKITCRGDSEPESIRSSFLRKNSTVEPDGEDIYYKFDWDDGEMSEWLGPYQSGDLCSATHTWKKRGNYEIKVKAKDQNGAESDWSESLSISMPKNSIFTNFYSKIVLDYIFKLLHLFQI